MYFMFAATYDISDFDATSSVASQIDFSLSFIQETRAQGAFMSFLFRDNGRTNFNNSLFFIINRSTAAATNQLTPLPMGNYLAQAYDLEADQEIVAVVGPTGPESKYKLSCVCIVVPCIISSFQYSTILSFVCYV